MNLKKHILERLGLLRQYLRPRARLYTYVRSVRLLGIWQSVDFVVRLLLRKSELVALKVPGIRTPLLCRPLDSDRFAFWQVFANQDLNVVLQNSPKLIIDAGANVGYASVYFANRYPGTQIIAIEPEPNNCVMFRKNCSSYPNIKLIEGALWSSSTSLVLTNPTSQSDTFFVKENVSHLSGSVQGFTVADILKYTGIELVDMIKIDIEGAEEELFSSDCSWIERVNNIIIEPHGESCRKAVFDAIEGQGFAVSQSGEYIVLTRTRCRHC